jgi:nucleoside-diphosphate-sugar epimerase
LEKKNSIIIVGCGFLGKAAAKLFSSQGYSVLGIVRSSQPEPSSFSNGAFSYLNCDVTDPSSVKALTPKIPSKALLIYCVSSGKGGSDAYAAIYREGFRRVVEAWKPAKIIFLENGGTRFINQIHRDDAARALFYLATKMTSPGIYNVTDNTPATQRDVYQWIADVLKKPLPPSGPADLNRKRGWTSKRISNEKLRATGWSPHFPSYREALSTLLLT